MKMIIDSTLMDALIRLRKIYSDSATFGIEEIENCGILTGAYSVEMVFENMNTIVTRNFRIDDMGLIENENGACI
jgi:hypothetical protein